MPIEPTAPYQIPMVGTALLIIWSAVALLVLVWAMRNARGWTECALGAFVAICWRGILALLVAVALHDWRQARRHRGRIF